MAKSCSFCGKTYKMFESTSSFFMSDLKKRTLCMDCLVKLRDKINPEMIQLLTDGKKKEDIITIVQEKYQLDASAISYISDNFEAVEHNAKYLMEKIEKDKIAEEKRKEEEKYARIKNCSVCGNPFSFGNGYGIKVKEGKICDHCFKKTSYCPVRRKGEDPDYMREFMDARKRMEDKSIEEIKKNIENKKNDNKLMNDFKSTAKYNDTSGCTCIEFDDKSNTFVVHESGFFNDVYVELFHYEQIENFCLLEDSTVITTGGGNAALIGGVLGGTTGAIIGATSAKKTSNQKVSDLSIKISLADASTNMVFVKFLWCPYEKCTKQYQTALDSATKCLKTLQAAYDKVHKPVKQEVKEAIPSSKGTMEFSVADEIRKLKQLYDEEIIDKEEFQMMKKKLMERL